MRPTTAINDTAINDTAINDTAINDTAINNNVFDFQALLHPVGRLGALWRRGAMAVGVAVPAAHRTAKW